MSESRVDRAIAPYFREPGLLTVLIVLVAHGVLGLGVALLDAIRAGMGYGLVALVLVGVGSVLAFVHDVRQRRLDFTSGTPLFCWVAGAACAWAADRFGFY